MKLDTSGVLKKWRSRFFSLRGSRLLYYREKPSTSHAPPSGYIPIIFASSIEPVSEKKNKNVFQIITDGKIYHLQAETTGACIF